MINVFRALNPFNILWLGIVLIVLRISYLVQPPAHIEFTFVEPFARLLIPVNYENFFTAFNNLVIAAVMVFIQALWLNQMVNKYSLLGKPSFLPALLYITVSALFTDFLILSPPLICNFLILWMIDKLLKLYDPVNPKAISFDLGMIVGIGTLIYFPYIYMFLAVWVGLVIFRPFNWREWVAVLIGFITIFFFLAVFYYLRDQIDQFYKIWLPLGRSFPNKVNINYYQYVVLIPVIVILALGIFRLRQNFFKSYVQMRKAFQLLTVIFVISALSFYVKTNFRLSHFIMCAVPAAIMLAYYFLYATKRWFYESLYLLLVIGIIYFQFNKF